MSLRPQLHRDSVRRVNYKYYMLQKGWVICKEMRLGMR